MTLSFFGETFVVGSAKTAELGEFPVQIPPGRIPTFVKVIQAARIDSMVLVNLTDTNYGHALKWDSAVR